MFKILINSLFLFFFISLNSFVWKIEYKVINAHGSDWKFNNLHSWASKFMYPSKGKVWKNVGSYILVYLLYILNQLSSLVIKKKYTLFV